jgi:hypothetical protein
MRIASTFGEAELLFEEDEVRMWSTSVSLLGPTAVVSILIEGPTKFVNFVEEWRPDVVLTAMSSDGNWHSCTWLGSGFGGADHVAFRYEMFQLPYAEPPVKLRLSADFRGSQVERELGPLVPSSRGEEKQ